MGIVILKNKITQVESSMDADAWDLIKNTPTWRGVFYETSRIVEPPEVSELKAKQNRQK